MGPKHVRVVSAFGATPTLAFLVTCLFAAIGSQAIAQPEVLPEPRLKSFKFAGRDLLKKDAVYIIPRGVEFELEVHTELGGFSASREDGILQVMGMRPDGSRLVLQTAIYKIKRLASEEVATAKIKIPTATRPYVAKLQLMQKNKVLIQRDISIVTEK